MEKVLPTVFYKKQKCGGGEKEDNDSEEETEVENSRKSRRKRRYDHLLTCLLATKTILNKCLNPCGNKIYPTHPD